MIGPCCSVSNYVFGDFRIYSDSLFVDEQEDEEDYEEDNDGDEQNDGEAVEDEDDENEGTIAIHSDYYF